MILDDILKRRDEQIRRVIAALAHLPVEQRIATIVMWMSMDNVEAMLKTIEKRRSA